MTDNDQKDTSTINIVTSKSMYEANYTNEGGKYKCYLPYSYYKPEEKVDIVKSPDGELSVHSVTYETDVLQYSVRYTDYPKKILKKFSQQQILMNVITAFFESMNMTVTRQDSTEKFEGYPTLMTMGQRARPEIDGYMYVYRRDFMVDNRLYQVGIIRLDHYPESSDFEQFVYSFELIK
jgi:hypothetical protein